MSPESTQRTLVATKVGRFQALDLRSASFGRALLPPVAGGDASPTSGPARASSVDGDDTCRQDQPFQGMYVATGDIWHIDRVARAVASVGATSVISGTATTAMRELRPSLNLVSHEPRGQLMGPDQPE
jgi:hypothetical protein